MDETLDRDCNNDWANLNFGSKDKQNIEEFEVSNLAEHLNMFFQIFDVVHILKMNQAVHVISVADFEDRYNKAMKLDNLHLIGPPDSFTIFRHAQFLQ